MSFNMSDSFPAISADQLTKSVSLAAGGALSALDAETTDDKWQNNAVTASSTKTEKTLSSETSLKLLEDLSTSVTCSLGKLNELSTYKPSTNSLPYNPRNRSASSRKITQKEKSPSTALRKYSTRKNYKLLPPLIPNEVKTNFKKPGPKTVLQRQLVTLGHGPNIRSPQELKSVPVRAARYTTNYVFLRTTQISVSSDGENKNGTLAAPALQVQDESKNSTNLQIVTTTLTSLANGNSPITQTAVGSSSCATICSTTSSSSTQILLPFSPKACQSPRSPAGPRTVSTGNDTKPLPKILPSPKFQPVLHLPYTINGVQSNVVLNPAFVSNDNSIIYIQNPNETHLTSGVSVQPVQQLDLAKKEDSQSQDCPSSLPTTQQSPLSKNNFEPKVAPVITGIQNILTPVCCSYNETCLAATAATGAFSPRLNQMATVTGPSVRFTQPTSQTLGNPQTLTITSGSTQPASTLLSTHVAAPVNSIMVSPGRYLLTSPGIQLCTSNNAVQAVPVPRMQANVVPTQSSKLMSNVKTITVSKQETNNQSKTLTASFFKGAADLVSSQPSSKTPVAVHLAATNTGTITTSAEVDQATALCTSSVPTPTSPEKTNSNFVAHVTNSKHIFQPLPVSKSVPECAGVQSSIARPMTAKVVAVQPGASKNSLQIAATLSTNAIVRVPTTLQSPSSAPIKEFLLNAPTGNNPVVSKEVQGVADLIPRCSATVTTNHNICVAVPSQLFTTAEGSLLNPKLTVTLPAVPTHQQYQQTGFATLSKQQQLHMPVGGLKNASSSLVLSASQPAQLVPANIQRSEDINKARIVGIQPPAKLLLPTTASFMSSQHGLSSDAFTSQPTQWSSPTTPSFSASSSEIDSLILSSAADPSLPLSKVAAAAAMVSLSSQKATISPPVTENWTKTITNVVRPSNPSVLSQPASSLSSPPPPPSQFLVPSSDGTKLVISSDGIKHLQTLLRKQGISEGYFIITSPRVPPVFSQAKGKSASTAVKEVPTNIKGTVQMTIKDAEEKGEMSVAKSFVQSTVSDDMVQTLSSKTTTNKTSLVECDASVAKKSMGSEESLATETDGSESDTSSSSESRSSPAVLVIETGEEEERMETNISDQVDSPESQVSSVRSKDIKEGENSRDMPLMGNSASSPNLTGQQLDSSWDSRDNHSHHDKQCIPQSPLSLSDLIRRQQHRQGFTRPPEYSFLTSPENKVKDGGMDEGKKDPPESPQLSNSENQDDFQFPMPLCPASAFGTLGHQQQQQQHADTEMQAGFQNVVYASSSSFSNDIHFDNNVQHSSMDNRLNQHIGDASSNTSPKMLSQSMNIASPKSPLSVNSSQAMDHSTPLNPPMTPNTMLINLLNRVPTPLLTNHQDLLSVPTSQENSAQDHGSASDFEMTESKTNTGLFPGKSIDFTDENHTQLAGTQIGDGNISYIDRSQSLSNNTCSYSSAQNALELIASNYAPSSTQTNTLPQESNTPQLSSNFNMIASKSFNQVSFSHCVMNNEAQPVNYSESYHQESDSHAPCHSYHCKSCTGPLLVTVNLDSDSPTYASVNLVGDDQQKTSGSLLETFEQPAVYDQSLSIRPHNEERPHVSSSINGEKSGETDILRHLILNTSSSSFHTLQPVQDLGNQHFDTSGSSFTMQQNQDNQFECRVESFLEPSDQQHKTLSDTDMTQGTTFPTQDQSFLHLNHVHTQPSSSFESSNTNFPSATHQSYENTVSSSFNNENNSTMDNPASSTYIMETNMGNDNSYNVQDMGKSSMPMPHDFLESDNRLQHLASFRSEDPQSEMFYQHSHAQQPSLHQHHYDPSNPHQNHTLEYHLDNLPSSHQPHQFSGSSLSHQDSARMYQDHSGSVGYLEGQYPAHYYDNGNVVSSLPMFSQQCAVGSEAPVLGSSAGHPCNIPYSNAPTGLQLEFRFPPEDDDTNNIEKQPVLPSASFSPPSVADQAATPELGGMSTYNGTFPNLSMYDMYVRGGNVDARGAHSDAAPESGNFCVECNMMYKGQCKFHSCDYTYVSDTPILSHARLTVPICLKLGTSSIVGHINNTGVFAKDRIAVRTKFGPLIGSPVSCDKLGSTRSFSLWQTFTGTNTKVMDTSDENSSNWLMFVKPARVSAEQNLVAFQHGSSVYFVTRMDIEPDEELLYWFAKDYSRMLGISAKPKNAHHQLCPHCTVCKQVFPDRKQIRAHMRLQHPKPCTKKCPHCSRKFLQTSHLNVHIMSVHMRVKKYVCPHCGKRFADSSNFSKHVKSHGDARLFKCQLCGKDFRQKAHLKNHMNTHMPVKNEQCGFCGKRFTRSFTRKQHELQHTKQNKIQCAHCDKVFYKQKIYRHHLKIHRNECNYVCQHCNKAFRSKGNLVRHGPACKQRKCRVIPLPLPQATLPPPPAPSASQMQAGDF